MECRMDLVSLWHKQYVAGECLLFLRESFACSAKKKKRIVA
jgi:hypothetical protein